MNAQETIDAGKLMVKYGEEWLKTGKRPEWIEGKYDPASWAFLAEPTWNWGKAQFRRRPEPKFVPLGPDDITPGAQFREVGQGGRWAYPDEAGRCGVIFKAGGWVSWGQLAEKFEWRTTDNPVWRPCRKES